MEPKLYEIMHQTEDNHWWFLARRKILDRMLSRLPTLKNADILEIGCGSGGNFSILHKYGNIYAAEMNEYARNIAQTSALVKEVVDVKLPDNIPFSGKQFDLIVMFDVLEHIEEDAEVLTTIKSMLKEDGVLFITVPAFKHLWSEHDVFCHHYRRYTKKTLNKALNDTGYTASYISYFNTLLYPLIFTARQLQKLFNAKATGGLEPPNKLVNSLLEKIFASERYLLGKTKFPFGVSLMAIANKH